jgi:hypothetical protein
VGIFSHVIDTKVMVVFFFLYYKSIENLSYAFLIFSFHGRAMIAAQSVYRQALAWMAGVVFQEGTRFLASPQHSGWLLGPTKPRDSSPHSKIARVETEH